MVRIQQNYKPAKTAAESFRSCFEKAIAAATLEERCEFHLRYDRLKQAQAGLASCDENFDGWKTARMCAHDLANLVQRVSLRYGIAELSPEDRD
jgi:hypothetical protein